MELKEITKEEFLKYETPLRTFYQDPKMDDWSKSKGYKIYYVGLYDGDKLVATTRLTASPNRFKKYYFYAPRGFLTDYTNFETLKTFTLKIKEFIKSKNGYVLYIDPYIIYKERNIDGQIVSGGVDNQKIVDNLKKLGYHHQGFTTGYDLKTQGRWYFVLDISKSYEEIFKNMRESTRRKIRKANKMGVEIVELSYDDLKKFKAITSETSTRKGFDDKSLEYYQAMKKAFQEKTKFLLARLNTKKYRLELDNEIALEKKKLGNSKYNEEEIYARIENLEKEKGEIDPTIDYLDLSVAMFIEYNREVSYLFGGSYKQYMKFYSQYLLQDYMIKYAIQNGYKRYNFYAITGIFDKKDKAYGVYDFKKGFGGVVEEYIGDFELPISSYYVINKFLRKIRK